MAVLAVLHHLKRPFLGHAEVPLRASGLELDQRFLRRGDPLPAAEAVDGLLVLGGEQSAVDWRADPLLAQEAVLLRELVDRGTPVLGICLGGQLLAGALGGGVRRVGRLVGWRALRRTPAGRDDPLFGALEDPLPALHFNEDVYEPPPGAVVLAEPEDPPAGAGRPYGCAAFRAGPCAWGVQYHPDVDGAALERWLVDWSDEVPDPDAFRAATAESLHAQARRSEALFTTFARIVNGDA